MCGADKGKLSTCLYKATHTEFPKTHVLLYLTKDRLNDGLSLFGIFPLMIPPSSLQPSLAAVALCRQSKLSGGYLFCTCSIGSGRDIDHNLHFEPDIFSCHHRFWFLIPVHGRRDT